MRCHGNMKPFITIVIPVYNAVRYVPNALNSIIEQEFREIEVLCMDDNSSDGSLELLQDYARQDSRIRVVPGTQNKGAGYRRNEGIDQARGEWIMFLDADDWYEKGILGYLAEAISHVTNIDVVEFPFYLSKTKTDKCPADWLDRLSTGIKHVERENILACTATSTKCWRLAFLRKYDLRFMEGNHSGEEIPLHLCGMLMAGRFLYLNRYGTNWRMNPLSLSRNDQGKAAYLNGVLPMLDFLKSELFRLGLYDEKKYLVMAFTIASWSLREKAGLNLSFHLFYKNLRQKFLSAPSLTLDDFANEHCAASYRYYSKLLKRPWFLFALHFIFKHS